MASSLLLLLLLSLLSSVTSLSPRVSFTLDSEDRPLIHLKLPDVHNTTTLLLSDDASTLYVGARDALLSLDVSQSDVISLKRKVDWRPSSSEIRNCEIKGKNATVDCPNFVRVLQLLNSTHLYTCGSFAFSPQEGFIDIQTFTLVPQGDGKGRCPFNPFQRNTAITVDGELFTATTSDFRGVKPQISRHLSTDQRPDVSQETSVSSLEEPTFVSSSLDAVEKKLYFFFSEVGREFSFVDQLQIARVAQVCKDDVGGQRTLQKKWTSFAKAPLLCQSPRQLPFNVLQDVFTLTGDGGHAPDTLFYGIFTSQWSSSPHSAVCVFRLQDVKTVFASSYRTFNMETHQWSPLLGNHPYLGKCGLGGATDTELAEVKKSFLTSNPVQPVSDGPVLVSSDQQYSRVVAMRTTAANNKQYTVLYLLTESGLLHRVVLFDRGARVVEEIQVFTQPQLVKSMVLSPTKGVLYVGTSEGVTGIPVANCSAYRTCGQCVLARDPLCGWSLSRRVCSRVEGGDENMVQDLENSSVDERCQHQTRAQQDTDIIVRLNEAVTLKCLKLSNMAALTWTSSQFKKLPEKLFIQSADGSLRFIASATTLGTYRCEVEEDGYKEVVTSYRVRRVAPPRSIRPSPMADDHVSNNKDEPFEDITTEGPLVSEPSGDPEDEEDMFTTNLKDETTVSSKDSGLKNQGDPDRPVTSRRETQSWGGPVHVAPEQKSYHTELVVVSILLVLCLITMAMGALHLWRRWRSELKTNPLVDSNLIPEVKGEKQGLSGSGSGL